MITTAGITTLCFIILVAIPMFFAATAPYSDFTLASITVGMIVVYSSARLAQIAGSSKQQVLRTTFWLFVYVFFGLTAFVQVTINTFPWAGRYQIDELVEASAIIIVGLVSFDLGQRLAGHQKDFGVPTILKRNITKFGVGLVGISALVSAPYLIQRLGGIYVFFLPRVAKFEAVSAEVESSVEMMLVSRLLSTPMFVSLVAAIAIWIASRQKRSVVGIRWKFLIFFLLIATMLLNNPISTPRFQVGTVLLSLFFVLPWRRWSNLIAIGGLVLGLVIVFPLTDLFRSRLDASLSQRIAETDLTAELVQGDFDAFQVTTNTISVVQRNGHQLGSQISGALLFWIPRNWWAGKPISTGQWIAERKGYHFTNLSAPLWAEFYVDGGWILILLGFIAYGYLIKTIDDWYARSVQHGRVQIITALAPIFAGYQFFFLRGALISAVASLAPIILFLFICSLSVSLNLFTGHRHRPKNLPKHNLIVD
ncbi:MAG: hypothetical protein AAF607_04615 [Pseudomonadota bacterium]